MKMIEVEPGLAAGLNEANELVVVVPTEHGMHEAKVTDIDELVRALRYLALIQAEQSVRAGVVPGREHDPPLPLHPRAHPQLVRQRQLPR